MNYKLIVGGASVAQHSNDVSGDNYTVIQLKDGKHTVLLSDGMGTGSSAYMESMAAINLLKSLLQSGFEKDVAVKILNSLLVLRYPKETFATIDLVVVDLYSGHAEFIKTCAAPTFLVRRK